MAHQHKNLDEGGWMKGDLQHAKTEYFIPDDIDRAYGLWVTTIGCQTVEANMSYPLQGHPSEYHFDTECGRVLQEYQLVYITKGKGRMFLTKDALFEELADKPELESDEEENLADALLRKQEKEDLLYFSGRQEEMTDTLFNGNVNKCYDRGGVNINKGSLLWIVPEQWHSYHPDQTTGWTEYYVGFKGEIIERLIKQSFLMQQISVVDLGMNEELVSLYMRALELARKHPPLLQQYLSGIVFHMLGLVMSGLKENEANDRVWRVQQAKAYMQEHICEHIELQDLATMLGMSYSWFRKEFKRQTGLSPAKFFQKMKIQKAKELLLSSPVSIKELYYYLGFNTTENFYTSFKKFSEGLTPIEYRRMLRVRNKR